MIAPVLLLDDGRYLAGDGSIAAAVSVVETPNKRTFTGPTGVVVERLPEFLDRGFDAAVELAPSDVVRLNAENRGFWEEAAKRGGTRLENLTSV